MHPNSSHVLLDVLRWLLVLPAAVLGAIAVQSIVRAIVQIADYKNVDDDGDMDILFSGDQAQLPEDEPGVGSAQRSGGRKKPGDGVIESSDTNDGSGLSDDD